MATEFRFDQRLQEELILLRRSARELGRRESPRTMREFLLMAAERLGLSEADVPSAETIRRFLKETVADEEEPDWQFQPGESHARVILQMVRAAMVMSGGRKTTLTVREAEWVRAIYELVPDIPRALLYRTMSILYELERLGRDRSSVEQFLLSEPWRDQSALEHYLTLIREWEFVPPAPTFLINMARDYVTGATPWANGSDDQGNQDEQASE